MWISAELRNRVDHIKSPSRCTCMTKYERRKRRTTLVPASLRQTFFPLSTFAAFDFLSSRPWWFCSSSSSSSPFQSWKKLGFCERETLHSQLQIERTRECSRKPAALFFIVFMPAMDTDMDPSTIPRLHAPYLSQVMLISRTLFFLHLKTIAYTNSSDSFLSLRQDQKYGLSMQRYKGQQYSQLYFIRIVTIRQFLTPSVQQRWPSLPGFLLTSFPRIFYASICIHINWLTLWIWM